MTGLVRYAVDDHAVAFVTLDSPRTRNALSDELLDDLLSALADARADDGVRAVVLGSSHERVFSAGGDLKAFAGDAPTITKYAGLTGSRASTGRSAASGSPSSARPAETSSRARSVSRWRVTLLSPRRASGSAARRSTWASSRS